MRTLKLRFPDDALPALDTFLKHTKDARVFRRAQAGPNPTFVSPGAISMRGSSHHDPLALASAPPPALGPYPRSDLLFLLPDGLGIDGGRR